MEYFSKQSKLFLIILGLLLTLLIGILDFLLDYQIGSDVSIGALYLFPISLVTWFVGRWAGILMCSVSVITAFIADSMTEGIYSHILYWNTAMLLCFFLVFNTVLSTFKNVLEREKKEARSDVLTGVANGRFFYELANIEISRASRYKRPFSVAYMDVDNFKVVNDRFGHSVGDSFLRLVAGTIRNNIRESDTIARLGGDEFAILMPETGYVASQIVISRVQKSLLDAMQNNGWPVTFSIGVVTFIGPPNSVDEIVKKADEAMYLVKSRGKNSTSYGIFFERGTQNKEEI